MSEQNPHDTYFKKWLEDKERSREFFENYLPESVKKVVDLSTLRCDDKSYVDDKFKDSHSDMLFIVDIDGEEGFLYLLFEHKSTVKKKVAYQLLKYMMRIWEKHSSDDKLPVIIPYVLYHGKSKWTVSNRLSGLYDSNIENIKEYVLDFRYIFYDLSVQKDIDIIGSELQKAILLLPKYIFDNDDVLIDKVEECFRLLKNLINKELQNKYLNLFFSYLSFTRKDDEGILEQEVYTKAVKIIGEKAGEFIMTIAERHRQEGIKEGIKEGKLEGIKEGKLEGIKEGEKKGKLEAAKRMLEKGLDIEFVAEITGLSKNEIKQYCK